MASLIPLEICSLICAEVEGSSSLAALCRTSRFFQDEAQRILYRTILWALAVIRNVHLAERVHALSLRLPESSKLTPSDMDDLRCALHACINLKELKLSYDEAHANYRHPTCVHGWMLDHAPFRLTKFANTYFQPEHLDGFWSAQSEIRVLSFLIPTTSPPFRSRTATASKPDCTQGPLLAPLPDGRPLQRLETSFTRDFTPLTQYSGTLTTLNLTRTSVDHEITLFGVVTSIVALLPALLHFGIAELQKRPDFNLEERSPAETLPGFLRLETFFVILRNVVRVRNPVPNVIYEMDCKDSLGNLASSIMAAFVGAEREVGQEGIDGKIQMCHGNEINFEAVSMFWKP
ncbi:hypothetical protein K438DRAFT_1885827 [Mycena galopus ATCC 62051]|nr:hypothetical protein K438DRAFT_1885827 [Mycena galopus ATCC 62051]